MIFPGSLNSHYLRPKINLAWAVVLMNIAIYVAVNISFHGWPQKNSVQELENKNFNQNLSLMYLQTLDPLEKIDLVTLPTERIATRAIRDQRFWTRAAYFPFAGDQVQIADLKRMLTHLKVDYQNSVQYQFGLGAQQTSPWAWITYQFTHFSFLHLLSNLIFLFLIISLLERDVAMGWIAAVYLLGGIGGGVGFLMFNSDVDLSVIGASGSVCALLCFLLVVKGTKNIPWIYFIAPVPKGYGEIYLPVFLILPVYLISDFSSLLWEPSGITSTTAHSAHVGGTLTGLVLGTLFLLEHFFRSKAPAHRIFSDNDGLNKLL